MWVPICLDQVLISSFKQRIASIFYTFLGFFFRVEMHNSVSRSRVSISNVGVVDFLTMKLVSLLVGRFTYLDK